MAIRGIDVSEWNKNINWGSVKNDGIEFAMIRASYGKRSTDNYFIQNVSGAQSVGMNIGTYHYCYAKNMDEIRQEAAHFLDTIKGIKFDYPVALDIEDKVQDGIDVNTLTDMTIEFLNIIENAGYFAMVYANKNFFTTRLDRNRLSRFAIWLAEWASKYTFDGDVGIWQYTSDGTVAGIDGRTDMNLSFVDYAKVIQESGKNNPGNVPTPTPTPSGGFSVGSSVVATNATLYRDSEGNGRGQTVSGNYIITLTAPGAKYPYNIGKKLGDYLGWVSASSIVASGGKQGSYSKGSTINLSNTPLFATATTSNISNRLSGVYYIYDGVEISGRYRITNSASRVGKQPIGENVTGFVNKSDIN